jgi:membrane protease subunit HflK
VAVVLAVAVVAAAVDSFYTIQPAERGVIQRFGAYHSVSAPGPHLKLPWIDTVQVVNVDQINKFVHRAQMLTRDENIVDVTVEVQFRILDAADFLFQDSNPGNTIHGSMESALREVIGKSDLDEIITENRGGIAREVKKGTQELLELYRTGLVVTDVNIQDAKAPEPVQEAFDDAIKAREDNVRLQNQAEAYANDVVPRARGAAARLIEDAKAYKAKVVAEADGESQRFLALLGEYEKAPQVTRERLYLETMQDVLQRTGKVMLDVKEGSNLTYLPLDRMIGQPSSVPMGAASRARTQIERDKASSRHGSEPERRNLRDSLTRDRSSR